MAITEVPDSLESQFTICEIKDSNHCEKIDETKGTILLDRSNPDFLIKLKEGCA